MRYFTGDTTRLNAIIPVNQLSVVPNTSQQLTVKLMDQFSGWILDTSGYNVQWQMSGTGGTITSSGVFTAGTDIGQFSATVQVHKGSLAFTDTTHLIVTNVQQIKGTIIGSCIPYGSSNVSYGAAFNNSTYDYCDCQNGTSVFTGYNFNQPKTITEIKYWPRDNWANRMVGATFEVSTDSINWTTIYTITQQPAQGQYARVVVANPQSAQYIRFNGSNGGNLNVAEIQFFTGKDSTTSNIAKTRQKGVNPSYDIRVGHAISVATAGTGPLDISIVDLRGRVIKREVLKKSVCIIERQNIVSGYYILQITRNNAHWSVPIFLAENK
jgi:hypothetical protein